MRSFTNSFIFSFSKIAGTDNDYVIRFRHPGHTSSDLAGIVRNADRLTPVLSKRDGSVRKPVTIVLDDSAKTKVEWLDSDGAAHATELWTATSVLKPNGYDIVNSYNWITDVDDETLVNG